LQKADSLRIGLVELVFVTGDPEAESYAKQLAHLLRKIGVQVGIDGLRMTREFPALDKLPLAVLVKDVKAPREGDVLRVVEN
jgi:hypothetical protein